MRQPPTFIHPDYPSGPAASVTPSGTAVDPYAMTNPKIANAPKRPARSLPRQKFRWNGGPTIPAGTSARHRLVEPRLRLLQRHVLPEAGDLKGASAIWDQVAGDSSADPLLRDLATLLWVQHQLDQGDPSLLEGRLKPLAAAGNPWRALAEEQLALLDLRQGKNDQAKKMLQRLADDAAAPSGVRGRASGVLTRLGG